MPGAEFADWEKEYGGCERGIKLEFMAMSDKERKKVRTVVYEGVWL